MATTTTTATAGELSGNVLLYKQPEPLHPETMGNLGLDTIEKPFMFAKEAHAVPLSVTEFGPASMRFPIIFTGEDHQPVAIMSIRQNENLFLQDNGFFEVDVYVPAFIRRYPFVLANENGTGRLIVCIDRAAEAVREGGEVKLFEGKELSAFAKNAVDFCTDFETERQRTVLFTKELERLGLFELKTANFTPPGPDGQPGETVKLAEYYGVSEAKLNALSAEDLVALRDSGALQQIYAHLSSLQNWERLVGRTFLKDGLKVGAVANSPANVN